MKLQGRVALVSGASRGIGEQIVRLFVDEGASVVFCGRRAELGEPIERSLREAGGSATFVTADASDEKEVEQLIRTTVEEYGQLDVVVSCAGVSLSGPIETTALRDWEEVVRINVSSMFLLTKHAIPYLRQSAHASVITFGSTFGHVGAAGSSAYSVTKAAAINFAKTAALELAEDRIRVNSLCPGGTRTGMLDEWLEVSVDADGTERALRDRHPIGRLSDPMEQAKAALFLASDDSSFVTGHALLVDGGYTAQ